MNILFVVPWFGGSKDGNPDVVDLAVELGKKRHNVVVLTSAYDGDAEYEKEQNVEIFRERPVYLSGMDYGISFPVSKIRELLKDFSIEIVHGVMEFGTQTLSAAAFSNFWRVPFVLTIQGAVLTFGSALVDATMTVFDHTLARVVSSTAKRVIILSDRLRGRAHRIGVSEEKIRIVPTTIRYREEFNPELFDAAFQKEELGLHEKVVVGFCGRLVPLKGVHFLIKALEILRRNTKNLCLLVLGDGPEKKRVESLSKRLDVDLVAPGWIRRADLASYLSAVDIFVNPSLTEGLPLTVMEAMAMRKAVVATDVGGTCDLLENRKNGFLVPPGDVESLVRSIETLALDENLRLDIGKAARATIEKKFDWNTIIPKVEKVYEEALQ